MNEKPINGSESNASSSTGAIVDEFAVTNPDTLDTANARALDVYQQIVGSEEQSSPDTLPGLAGRLMDAAGDIPGKYDPPVALSTHLINATVIGVTVYVYDQIVRNNDTIDEEEIRLLVAALALHDTNKYVDGVYDVEFDTRNNTEQVLDFYFRQGDDFDIKRVLPGDTESELELDIADVKWLVQRTETKDTTSSTRGKKTKRAKGLQRYCRIGDGFVSKVHSDGLGAACEWLESFFNDSRDDVSHVQYLTFSKLEQPVLNEHLLAAVKDVIRGRFDAGNVESPPVYGLLLGSTPESVAYLGEEIDREALRGRVEEILMERITENHEFSAKTNWNSFEYDILAEIDIPFDEKRAIIAEGFAETLSSGSGTDHEFETVPEEFISYVPEVAKVVFRDQTYEEAFVDYPAMSQLWDHVNDTDTYNSQTRKIGYLAELLRRYMGSVDDGYDYKQIRSELTAFSDAVREELQKDLTPKSRVGRLAVDRFFDGGVGDALSLPSAHEMCFLCGRPAEIEYKKGDNAFYGTNSFSKRVPPEASYKRICPVCNLEHAILRDTIEDHDYSVDEDIKIAFVYYNDFVADLGVRGSETASGLIRALHGRNEDRDVQVDIADPELVAASFGRQYHLQPIYVDSENRRLRGVRELLADLVTYGFKVVIGKPFAGFRPQDALFADLNPTRRQTAYGAARIESYVALERVNRLFDILRQVADGDDYTGGREMTQLQRDGFHVIADLVVRKSEYYEYSVRSLAHEHFVDTHEDKYMQMRDVAQEGFDLYRTYDNSTFKKTKIFRKAVDASLDGLNRGMNEERLLEHVSGQVYKTALADAEKTYYVNPDEAEAFVTALFDLLRETNELNKEDLSKRRNTLSNTYLFAYDRLLYEQSGDDGEEERSDEEATA